MSWVERLLERERSALLVIDLQESYRGKFANEARVVEATGRLIDAALLLVLTNWS